MLSYVMSAFNTRILYSYVLQNSIVWRQITASTELPAVSDKVNPITSQG